MSTRKVIDAFSGTQAGMTRALMGSETTARQPRYIPGLLTF